MTDSNYITFPHLKLKTAAEIWDYAVMVADEVSKLFPSPLRLEYEEAVYKDFFILTKKRYLYLSSDRDGVIDKKIGKRGVAISRRDNSLLLRILYEKVIQMIFDRVKAEDILYFLLEELNKVCSKSYDYSNFVLTKSIKDVNNMELISFKDEKGNWYKAGGDGSIFYTVIEKADPNKIKVVQDIVYNYNDISPLNDYKVNANEQTKNANRILTQ